MTRRNHTIFVCREMGGGGGLGCRKQTQEKRSQANGDRCTAISKSISKTGGSAKYNLKSRISHDGDLNPFMTFHDLVPREGEKEDG